MARDPEGFVRLVEEVPGVPKEDKFYIYKTGTGKLWNGSTKEEGEDWAKENGIAIDQFEPYEP